MGDIVAAKPPVKIWLATDESLPFEHVVDGDCVCKLCESKPKLVILTQ